MFKNLLLISILGTAVGLGACGKDKKEDKGGEGSADKAQPAQGDGPSLDCPAFETKMNECLEPFAEAYSKTETGQKAGTNTDGTVDHEAAAKRFKMLWGLEGAKLCTGNYAQRDPRWRERFVACDNSAACDVWAPCMSTAIGEMLK